MLKSKGEILGAFALTSAVLLALLVGALVPNLARAVDTDVEAPQVQVTPVQPQQGRLGVEISVGANEVVEVKVRGIVRHKGKKFKLRRGTATVAPGGTADIELTMAKRRQEKRLLTALGRGATRIARITVVIEDAGGNTVKRKAKVRLTRS